MAKEEAKPTQMAGLLDSRYLSAFPFPSILQGDKMNWPFRAVKAGAATDTRGKKAAASTV